MVLLFTEKVQKDYLGPFAVEAILKEFEESLEQIKGIKLGAIPLLVITGGTQSRHPYIPVYSALDDVSEGTCQSLNYN